MDVIIGNRSGVTFISSMFHYLVKCITSCLLAAASLIPGFAGLILLGFGSTALVNASQIVPPMPKSDWEYHFVHCTAGHFDGPFQTEVDAAEFGKGIGRYSTWCDPYISDWRAWYTFENKQNGPCGSSKRYPLASDGIEYFNYRKAQITSCDGKSTETLPIKRERTVGCPDGYSSNGNTCELTSYNFLKTAGPMCPIAGNPIYPGTGNKYQREVDYPLDAIGSISFVRHYNSRLSYTRTNQTIRNGTGWSNTYTRQVNRIKHRGITVATIVRPEGRAYNYTLDADGSTWTADEDVKGNLQELIDGSGVRTGWRYRTPDDVTELYDATGRLLSIADLQGRIQTLTYDLQDPNDPAPQNLNYPSRVDSNTGEYLLFTYNSKHRLVSMEDHAGRIWSYRYGSNDNLEFVDNPDQTTRQYHYEDTGTGNLNALTGITDERGQRYATFEYRAGNTRTAGLAIASYHGPQTDVLTNRIEGITIDYDIGQRTLTNSNGDVSTYGTLIQQGVILVTDVSGPGCATCSGGNTSYDYDAVNNNLLSKTENGVTVKYGNFDDNGNYQCKVEGISAADASTGECAFDPAASPNARRTDYSYDSRYFSKVETQAESSVYPGGSKVTSYTYDDFGNRTSETETGFAPTGEPVVRTISMEFNGPLNQLSLIDGARTDVSDVTVFRYYANDASQGNNRARLKEIEDASGALIRSNIQYTDTGKVASESRPNGLSIAYSYYPGNDLLEALVEGGVSGTSATRWTYLATGEVSSVTIAAGTPDATSIMLAYDDARRLTRISDGLGSYIEYTLDTEGNRLSENIYDSSATLAKTLSQTFDVYNRLDVTSQANEKTDYQFSPDGTLAREMDGKNAVKSYSYDELKRLLVTTQDDGGLDAVTRYSYDASDNITSVIDPVNGNTGYQYDDLGNLVGRSSPDTGTVVFSYDEDGNQIRKRDAEGYIQVYSYDELNRLTGVDAPGTVDDITFVYDNCQQGSGRLCSVLTSETTVDYSYDSFGNVAAHQQLAYGYDTAKRVRAVTYPSGAVIAYSYDAAGQVSRVDLESDGSIKTLASNISYQPFGPVENYTYGNSAMLTQNYDAAYRLTDQKIPGVMDLGYLLYDANGNLKTRTDAYSGTSTFSYDALDRLTAGDGGFGVRDYDYDLNGNRVLLDDGSIHNYEYSPASNRLLSEADWMYTLDANGSVTGKVNADGEGRIYKYNSHNRLVMSSDRTIRPARRSGGQSVITDTVVGSYVYNGLGQRASKNTDGRFIQFLYGVDGALMAELDAAGEASREYIYLNSQLLAVLDHKASAPGEGGDIVVDNSTPTAGWTVKTSKRDYGSDYLYSDGGSGNTVRWVPTLGAGSYEVYVWYVRGRRHSNNVPYTVLHNGQSETVPVDQSTGGVDWLLLGTYSFDGDGSEYVEVSDATGKTTADAVRFVNVGGGSVSTTTTLSYVHNDHLGKPQVMTDEVGNVVWRAVYDPFGRATVDSSSDVDMNVRFPGQYFDQETGLHQNGFRTYDPGSGRYLTADPLGIIEGQDLNLYAYVGDNPVNWIDPLGLLRSGRNARNFSNITPRSTNGNLFGNFKTQDNVCTKPADKLNSNPCTKQCCIAHDSCYERFGCNASSWFGNLVHTRRACQLCNLLAAKCVIESQGRSDCNTSCGKD